MAGLRLLLCCAAPLARCQWLGWDDRSIEAVRSPAPARRGAPRAWGARATWRWAGVLGWRLPPILYGIEE